MFTVQAEVRVLARPQKSTTSRWLLASVMLFTIVFGWRFPVIGFIVPTVMMMNILYSLHKGRYACGNVCPRGSFFDTVFRPFSGTRTIPTWLRTATVRWSIFAGLMGFMAVQISRNPGELRHWGFVFWLACTLTTIVAIGLGRAWQARTWCALCPIGTLAAALGKDKHQLLIASQCTGCGRCEQSCPMELSIAVHRVAGQLSHGDCIKCSNCHAVCPQQALHWPEAA